MKQKRIPRFESEADLCTVFAARARSEGFVVHAETSGWDLLLVRGDVQVGVQAKLDPNLSVVSQALPADPTRAEVSIGPTHRAVLLPGPAFNATAAERERYVQLRRVCIASGLLVFHDTVLSVAHRTDCATREARSYGAPRRHAALLDTPCCAWTWIPETSIARYLSKPARWSAKQPEWLPDVVVQHRGGVPNPRAVTQWKLAAVRLCLLLAERGYLTGPDFKGARPGGVSVSTWLQRRWLRRDGSITIRPGERSRARYVARPAEEWQHGQPRPDVRYPEIVAALRAAPGPA